MNDDNIIIGLVGKLQCGKTTSAKIINKYYQREYNVFPRSFGDFLKKMILNAGICNYEELWGKKTEYSRLMMQKIGTDIIRKQVSKDFWVSKMMNDIFNIIKSPFGKKLIIIDDVRFLNEADLIREFKGILIRITRPSLEQNKDENKHVSETEQDIIITDHVIINDGSILDLENKLNELLEKL